MTEAPTALARRAVACKGWRWMAGALDDDGCTVCSASDDGYLLLAGSEDSTVGWWPIAKRLPDLTDPATIGCLLALVRTAWGCAVITSPEYDYDDDEARQGPHVTGWRAVETVRWLNVGEGATEAEALVAALEGAP